MERPCAEQMDEACPRLPLAVTTVDTMCLLGGAVPALLRFAGGLPMTRRGNVVLLGAPITALPLRVAGAALAFGSMLLRRAAVDRMDAAQVPLRCGKPVPCVVGEGPYAVSRNPMYLGTLGSLLALGPLLNSWWGVLAAFPMAGYLHCVVIPSEERYLGSKFPEYRHYMATTPRWIV